MLSIRHIPEAVHSTVRSGIILYDLTRVVEELVFNSLDAGATKVSVALNVSTCYVKVVDNGSGVTRDGLILLGEKYATSKHDCLGDTGTVNGSFGFRGEALGSISDFAVLEINSKTYGMPNGYTKVMKGCKCLYLGISDDRKDVGTTVIVRDLFYNQPVRRKHIQSSPKKVLHSVKKCVLRIALVHPKVSFRVIDIESEEDMLSAGPSSSPFPLLRSGFGLDASSSFRELNISDGMFRLSGYISGPSDVLSPKVFQYIYINSRFVCKGPIHKLLNQLALRLTSVGQREISKRSCPQICPTFLLNLKCKRFLYDITSEASRTTVEFKDWGLVLSFIENAISEFWSETEPDALSVECDNGNKRRKTQKCKVSLECTSSSRRRPIEECTSLPSWRREFTNSFEKSYRVAPDWEEPLADCSLQSYDATQAYYGDTIGWENSSYGQQSCCASACNEKNVLENELLAAETPFKLVKCNLGSKREDTPIKADARIRDISENVSACKAFIRDDICINQENTCSFLRSCFSCKSLLGDESSFRSDDAFELKTDDFEIEGKWDGNDDRVDAADIDNRNQNFRVRSPLHRKQSYMSLFSLSRSQNFTNADFISENKIDSLLSPSLIENEEYFHLPDMVKPIRELSASNLSCLLSDNSVGVGFQSSSYTDEEGTSLLDKNMSFEYSSDITEKDSKFCFGIFGGLEQENFTASRFLDPKVFVGNRSDFRDCSLEKDTFDQTDWIWSQTCRKENFPVLGYSTSFIDGDRDACEYHVRCQGEKSDCRKKTTRSHSAPPFYGGRKKFSASSDFFSSHDKSKSLGFHQPPCLPETSVKHSQDCSTPGSWNHPPQLPGQCHLPSVRSPAVISGANTSPDFDVIPNSKSRRKDNRVNTYEMNLLEDYRSSRTECSLDSELKWRGGFPQPSGAHISCNNKHEASILDTTSGILHLSSDSLVPNYIDKSFLESAKVLQQVDKKFIPVVGGKILAIIDQHAADERIQLEELRQKLLSGEMKTITYLDAEQELVLPEIGYQLLHNYAEEIQSWGWICNINARNSMSFSKNLKSLHKQPAVTRLLAVPCILGVNLTDVDLLEYLQQLADTDGSSTMPPAVHRILNNKACRGAIMFGDALLPSECSLIVEELKHTSLCFQCAHGRPTTVPLVNMEVLHELIAKLGSASNASNESWHGLGRHKISLERAARRLS